MTSGGGDLHETSLCTWFGFWAQFVLLAFACVIGLMFAGGNAAPGDQTCGVVLVLAAVALMFMRLKNWFDYGNTGWSRFFLVDDMPNLIAVTGIFVVLGIVGMNIAAQVDHGGLHNGAVALIVASGFGIFLSIKNVFDNIERRG
jgi:hypothetical protein